MSEQKTGIKMLLSLKRAQECYNNFTEGSIDDYWNEIKRNNQLWCECGDDVLCQEFKLDKESKYLDEINKKESTWWNDVDDMWNDVQALRRKIEIQKKIDKIKEKETHKSPCKENNKLSISNEEVNKQVLILGSDEMDKYKQYWINTNDENQEAFGGIKEKWKEQEKKVKEKLIILNSKDEEMGKKSAFITENYNEDYNGDEWSIDGNNDELEKLFAEIKIENIKMDNCIEEIDECWELNNEISRKWVAEQEDDVYEGRTKALW